MNLSVLVFYSRQVIPKMCQNFTFISPTNRFVCTKGVWNHCWCSTFISMPFSYVVSRKFGPSPFLHNLGIFKGRYQRYNLRKWKRACRKIRVKRWHVQHNNGPSLGTLLLFANSHLHLQGLWSFCYVFFLAI